MTAARQDISNLKDVIRILGKLLNQGVNVEKVATALGSFTKMKNVIELLV